MRIRSITQPRQGFRHTGVRRAALIRARSTWPLSRKA